MRNLLSAGLVRLFRCKSLWLSCALAAALEIFAVLDGVRDLTQYGLVVYVDSRCFCFVALVGLLSALVSAFAIGPEYGDGAMRNKIATGCRRRDVYLANLILTSLASLVLCLAAVLPALALGLPLLGGFHMGAARAGITILGICLMAVTYASVFTLVMMQVDRRAVSSVAALVLAIALLAAGGYLNGRLDALPTVQGYQLSVNGELVEAEPLPNPDYLPDGPARRVFQFLYDVLPGGQSIQYASLSADRPALLMACDGGVMAASTAAGLALFRRKDLK